MSVDTREAHLVYDDEGAFLWSGSRAEVDRVAQKQDGTRITRGSIDDEGNVTGEVDVWTREAPSLTTEQARRRASRFTAWASVPHHDSRGCVSCGVSGNTNDLDLDSRCVDHATSEPLESDEAEQLFAWVRVLGGVDEDHSVLALLAAFGWEYHAGYGHPSYTDALTLLRAARAS